MSHVFVPTRVHGGSITLPDDGDVRQAGTVNVALEALANRVAGAQITTYNAANADETYQSGGALNQVYVSGLTADRIYTLTTAGAIAGDVFEITVDPAVTFKATIKVGATVLAVLSGSGASTGTLKRQSRGGRFIYRLPAATWEKLSDDEVSVRAQFFTADGTFTVPPLVNEVLIFGCGGGGGGGGGGGANTSSPPHGGTGGGGGGAALMGFTRQPVSPGTVYDVVIGTGGAGGAAGLVDATKGGDGANGTSSRVALTGGGSTIALFPPGRGGEGGVKTTAAYRTSRGGGPGQVIAGTVYGYHKRQPGDRYAPGYGGCGYGTNQNPAVLDPLTPEDLYGTHFENVPGAVGGNAGTRPPPGTGTSAGGGGPGGGGGSSGFPGGAVAGAGGNGSNGQDSPTAVTAGFNGINGTLGCGGGGGGGPGGGDNAGQLGAALGGAGGAGGSGAVLIVWVK